MKSNFKKALFVFGILFLLLFVSYKAFFYFDKKEEQFQVSKNKSNIRLTRSDINKLQEGDIILRRGYGYFSDMIADHLNTKGFDVTHAGILTKKNNHWFVIHSLSSDVSEIDGMQIQKLTDFLKYSQPNKIIVSRFKKATENQRKEIATEAQKLLDLKIPFDHKGDIEDASKMYCTEMIWYILENQLQLAQIPKEKKAREVFFYSMKCMYDTTYFDLVINKYKD